MLRLDQISRKPTKKTPTSKWSDYSIVVSRFKEKNIYWLNDLGPISNDNVYIYNKKNDSIDSSYDKAHFKNNFLLPNIGKCDHSFLWHVVHNYHTLKEFTLFLTPHYTHHKPHTYETLETTLDWFEICDRTLWSYKPAVFYSPNCKLVNYFCSDYRLGYYATHLKPNKDNYTFGEWLRAYVEPDIDAILAKPGARFHLNFGGNMCYSATSIKSRPLEFYQKLLEQFEDNDSEVAHYFERAWYYIFNAHKYGHRIN